MGRPPLVPDAALDAAAPDAVPRDAAPVDAAGAPDSGGFDGGANDAGPPVRYPFTGVFGIVNDASLLYAREVDGQLLLTVGRFPYVYFGQVDREGQVSADGPVLEAGGCPQARITGTYDRFTATFDLVHRTCNAQILPVEGRIRGGFGQDFSFARSGEYDLQASVTLDLAGCYRGPDPVAVRYAVNQLDDRQLQVFTVNDPTGQATVYIGQLQPGLERANLTRTLSPTGTSGLAMTVLFSRVTALDPWRLTGSQDVYDAVRDCTYRVELDGVRVRAP